MTFECGTFAPVCTRDELDNRHAFHSFASAPGRNVYRHYVNLDAESLRKRLSILSTFRYTTTAPVLIRFHTSTDGIPAIVDRAGDYHYFFPLTATGLYPRTDTTADT